MSVLQKLSLTTLTLLIAAVIALGIWKVAGTIPPSQWLDFVLNKDTNPLLFIILMAILPCIGAPISLFLVLSGIKFGLLWGLLLTVVCTAIHLILTYPLARGLVFTHLAPFLQRYGREIPQIPAHRAVGMTVLFTALPGPPYALKNYLLVAGGVPFPVYLLVAWPIHVLMAIPFVGIGDFALRLNVPMLLLFLALLVGGSLLIRKFGGRWKRALDLINTSEPPEPR